MSHIGWTDRSIASAWVALSDTTVQGSAIEFVRASHADENYYAPAVFGNVENNPSAKWQTESKLSPVPDIQADRSNYDIVAWDMNAGDAVVFSLPGAPIKTNALASQVESGAL